MYEQYLKLISLLSSETIDYSSSDKISKFLFFFFYILKNHAYSEIYHTILVEHLTVCFDSFEIRSKKNISVNNGALQNYTCNYRYMKT